MFANRSDHQNEASFTRRPAIETLESRTLLSAAGTPVLAVTVPGPIPATGIAGAKLKASVEVTIANDGSGKSSGKTMITLYATPDGTFSNTDAQLTTVTKSLNVPAGFSKNVVIKVGALPQNLDGEYFILASVSAPTQTVQGVSTSAIDVTPVHIDLANAVTSVPAVGHLGGKINVALDITNEGNGIAKGTLDTLFELSTSPDGSNPFQVTNIAKPINLSPGKSKIVHWSVPVALGSPSGNQYVVAVLDPMDVFADTNIANNTAISATPVSFR